MLDDSCNDRRRSKGSADANKPILFDANKCRIALDLCSKVGAMTLLLRNQCGHWRSGHFDNLHGLALPYYWRIVRNRFPAHPHDATRNPAWCISDRTACLKNFRSGAKIEKGDLDPIATRTPELDQLVDHVLEAGARQAS